MATITHVGHGMTLHPMVTQVDMSSVPGPIRSRAYRLGISRLLWGIFTIRRFLSPLMTPKKAKDRVIFMTTTSVDVLAIWSERAFVLRHLALPYVCSGSVSRPLIPVSAIARDDNSSPSIRQRVK